MKKTILIAVLLLSLCGCKEQTVTTRTFPYISAPALMQNQKEITNFLARHFWRDYFKDIDSFVNDTKNIIGVSPEQFTEAFGQYALFLDAADISSGRIAQDSLLSKAAAVMAVNPDSKILSELVKLEKHYFFDVNSPYRC